MIQFRIIEKYDKHSNRRRFYPEIKKYFFWSNLRVSDDQVITNVYDSYDEAKQFLISRMPKVLFHCIEHPFSKEPIIYHMNPNHINQ